MKARNKHFWGKLRRTLAPLRTAALGLFAIGLSLYGAAASDDTDVPSPRSIALTRGAATAVTGSQSVTEQAAAVYSSATPVAAMRTATRPQVTSATSYSASSARFAPEIRLCRAYRTPTASS